MPLAVSCLVWLSFVGWLLLTHWLEWRMRRIYKLLLSPFGVFIWFLVVSCRWLKETE